MLSEEELNCEDDVWFFDNIILHVKKEIKKQILKNRKIDFYSWKEIFIP